MSSKATPVYPRGSKTALDKATKNSSVHSTHATLRATLREAAAAAAAMRWLNLGKAAKSSIHKKSVVFLLFIQDSQDCTLPC